MQGSANFFLKDKTVNSLGFVGYMISIVTTQLYHCNHCHMKAAIDNMDKVLCNHGRKNN